MSDRVNDFAFKIGTVNGTGSASANGLIMQAIFRMGIPVTGKNLFPSNIQGLPTWYEIRVNKNGYTARTPVFDLMVALNSATYEKDVEEVRSGGWLMYDSTWPLNESLIRNDVNYVGVPLAEMCNAAFRGVRERILMKNIAYAGALIAVLDVDMAIVEQLLDEKFSKKQALRESNRKALKLGYDYAKANFDPLPFRLERMDANGDKILIDGNTATALGCVYAGATVAAWYPITPSTSVMDAFTDFCAKYRRDKETGEMNAMIIQAEDELAAIGMVIGAGWNGARAFTSTSGPGISLMNELLGLAYYAEIPAVIMDIQRVGPSTGMPTRTQQGDILECAYASHGDTKHVLLFPQDPNESFTFAADALDLADRLQTPVFVMMDLDIGMNDWLVPPLQWDAARKFDRGKVMGYDALEAGTDFGRYLDVDGDGIPYRTLPGTHPTRGAYFTRGTTKDRYARYTEEGGPYVDNMQRLLRKFETAKRLVPRPIKREASEATKYGAIYFGSSALAMEEALEALEARGIHLDTLRVRAFPFHDDVVDFISNHERVFVVEQNRDKQMRTLVTTELEIDPARLVPILHYDGTPITARFIVKAIADMLAVVTLAPLRKALP